MNLRRIQSRAPLRFHWAGLCKGIKINHGNVEEFRPALVRAGSVRTDLARFEPGCRGEGGDVGRGCMGDGGFGCSELGQWGRAVPCNHNGDKARNFLQRDLIGVASCQMQGTTNGWVTREWQF